MNDNRQLVLKGPLNLFLKNNQLFFQPGFVPVKIDPDLSYGHKSFRSCQVISHYFKFFFIRIVHGSRMQPDHRETKVTIGITNRQHRFDCRTVYIGHKNMRNTGSTGTLHYQRQIFGKFFQKKMGM